MCCQHTEPKDLSSLLCVGRRGTAARCGFCSTTGRPSASAPASGEFVHELARALAETGTDDDRRDSAQPPGKTGRPRTLPPSSPASPSIDRRIPVRRSDLVVESPELAAGRVARRSPPMWCTRRHPLLIPASRAAQVVTIHDLDFLLHPDRAEAEMRRDFPALVRQHARRADHIVVSSQYAAGEVAVSSAVPCATVTVCSPGAPAWAATIARERRISSTSGSAHPLSRHARAAKEHRRPARRLRAPARTPPGRAAAGAGRSRDATTAARDSGAPERASLAGHVDCRRLCHATTRRRRLYRDARMLVLPSLEEGLRSARARSHGLRRAGGRSPTAARCPRSPATRPRPSIPLIRTRWPSEMERLLDPRAARVATASGLAQRAALLSWDRCAARPRATPIAQRSRAAARRARDENCRRCARACRPADRRRPLSVGIARSLGTIRRRPAARLALYAHQPLTVPDALHRVGRRDCRDRRHALGTVDAGARAGARAARCAVCSRLTRRPLTAPCPVGSHHSRRVVRGPSRMVLASRRARRRDADGVVGAPRAAGPDRLGVFTRRDRAPHRHPRRPHSGDSAWDSASCCSAREVATRADDPVVGSIFRRRHVETLIDAFVDHVAARVPGSRLEIVGENRMYPPFESRRGAEPLRARDRAIASPSAPTSMSNAARPVSARVGVRVSVAIRRFGLTPLEALGRRRSSGRARHAGRPRGLRRGSALRPDDHVGSSPGRRA